MTPRAILFDLDDTIIDRKLSLSQYAICFADYFGSKIAQLTIDELNSILRNIDCGGYKKREDFFADLRQALPWIQKPQNSDELRLHWFANFPQCCVVANGLFETLHQLATQGILFGIITNGRTSMQNLKIDQIGIRPLMRSIIVSETVNVRKPEKEIFHLALRELKVDVEDAWFVGDNPITDIVGASGAGLTAVWLRGKHEWDDTYESPKLQIDSFKELIPLIEKLHRK